eukprot:gb/GECG01016226.1/.p1 GENE.gb/GECG01016226.1/~~gb/GECG01016226.1/.p1  ORF type:complete len:500 (+),score=85.62 gb/GECG01016226.1/:1-1500(+)
MAAASSVDKAALGSTDEEIDQVIDQFMQLSPADRARIRGATLRRKEHPEAPSQYPCVMGNHPGEVYEIVEEEEMHPVFMNDEQIEQESAKGNTYVKGLMHSEYSDEQGPMELAASCKARGNESFKRGKAYFAQALRFYNEALEHCENIEKKDQNAKKLESVARSNLAAIYLTREKYSYTIVETEKALELWSGNVKAAYRGAKSAVHLGHYKKGKRLAEQGLKSEPDNNALKKLAKEAQEGIERNERRQKEKEAKEKQMRERVETLRRSCEERGIQVAKPVMSNMQSVDNSYPYIDEYDCVHWPALLLYPEHGQTDFICDWPEVVTFHDQMSEVLPQSKKHAQECPELVAQWDTKKQYRLDNVDFFYRANWKKSVPLNEAWNWWIKPEEYNHEDDEEDEEILQEALETTQSTTNKAKQKNAKPSAKTLSKNVKWGKNDWVRVPGHAPLLLPLVQKDHVVADIPVFFVVAKNTDYYMNMIAEAKKEGHSFRTLEVPDFGGQ